MISKKYKTKYFQTNFFELLKKSNQFPSNPLKKMCYDISLRSNLTFHRPIFLKFLQKNFKVFLDFDLKNPENNVFKIIRRFI